MTKYREGEVFDSATEDRMYKEVSHQLLKQLIWFVVIFTCACVLSLTLSPSEAKGSVLTSYVHSTTGYVQLQNLANQTPVDQDVMLQAYVVDLLVDALDTAYTDPNQQHLVPLILADLAALNIHVDLSQVPNEYSVPLPAEMAIILLVLFAGVQMLIVNKQVR